MHPTLPDEIPDEMELGEEIPTHLPELASDLQEQEVYQIREQHPDTQEQAQEDQRGERLM